MIFFTEAIKLENGILHNLEYHQKRANRTTSKFYNTQIDLFPIQHSLPIDVKQGLYKCRIVYGAKIEKVEFIPYIFKKLNQVKVVVDNNIDYSYKYADRSNLTQLVQSSGCDEIIIIRNGMITDASASNLVFESIKNKQLITPSDYLLCGTKRQYLIDKGIIREKSISIEEIANYNQVYFISSMIDLEDNIKIDVKNLLF